MDEMVSYMLCKMEGVQKMDEDICRALRRQDRMNRILLHDVKSVNRLCKGAAVLSILTAGVLLLEKRREEQARKAVNARSKHASEANQADMEIVKTLLRMAEKADTTEEREYHMRKAEEIINKMDARSEDSERTKERAKEG